MRQRSRTGTRSGRVGASVSTLEEPAYPFGVFSSPSPAGGIEGAGAPSFFASVMSSAVSRPGSTPMFST